MTPPLVFTAAHGVDLLFDEPHLCRCGAFTHWWKQWDAHNTLKTACIYCYFTDQEKGH